MYVIALVDAPITAYAIGATTRYRHETTEKKLSAAQLSTRLTKGIGESSEIAPPGHRRLYFSFPLWEIFNRERLSLLLWSHVTSSVCMGGVGEILARFIR